LTILKKNKDVKGLLVFHYLGTGKTFLSIGFAERNPTKKIVLIVPRFLMGHWKKNMSIYGVKDPSRYKIVSHSSPEEILKLDLKNSIVIVDESHRLINKINENNPTISNTYAQLYLKIRSAYKVL
jgi:superfamily II DNA or RNA helicase